MMTYEEYVKRRTSISASWEHVTKEGWLEYTRAEKAEAEVATLKEQFSALRERFAREAGKLDARCANLGGAFSVQNASRISLEIQLADSEKRVKELEDTLWEIITHASRLFTGVHDDPLKEIEVIAHKVFKVKEEI